MILSTNNENEAIIWHQVDIKGVKVFINDHNEKNLNHNFIIWEPSKQEKEKATTIFNDEEFKN